MLPYRVLRYPYRMLPYRMLRYRDRDRYRYPGPRVQEENSEAVAFVGLDRVDGRHV